MILRRLSFPVLCLIALGLAVYAFWIEPRRLVTTELTLPIENLAEEVRMVVIADVQPAGPHHTAERMRKIMAKAAGLKGDIVLLLGDYVSKIPVRTSFTEPADTANALGQIAAPMGVYAVLGNHDWGWNGPKMRRLLQAQGIAVLENRAALARDGAKALWIAGLADPISQFYDLPRTLAQTDDAAPVILLTHSPDVFPEVPQDVALTVAGHTHGGQVYLPGLGRPIVPSRFGERYARGHIVEDGRQLFVSSGIGNAIVPVRFLTPPELVVITLTPAALTPEGPSPCPPFTPKPAPKA